MKPKKQTKKTKQTTQKKLYQRKLVLIPALLIAVFLAWMLVKEVIAQYDISLLNKAERTMRSVEGVPQPDSVEYSRSCSFRSKVFGPQDPPICRVTETRSYNITDNQEAVNLVDTYINKYSKRFALSRTQVGSREYNGDFLSKLGDYYKYIDELYLQKGLKCYQNYSLDRVDEKPTDQVTAIRKELIVFTSCYKRFPKQVYPEL